MSLKDPNNLFLYTMKNPSIQHYLLLINVCMNFNVYQSVINISVFNVHKSYLSILNMVHIKYYTKACKTRMCLLHMYGTIAIFETNHKNL